MQDVLRYCCFTLILQLAIFVVYSSRAGRHAHSAESVVQHVVDVFIAAVSPAIPTIQICTLLRCVVNLKQHSLAVLHTAKVKTAAAVDVVVFDKTGTLTGNVVGVVECVCAHIQIAHVCLLHTRCSGKN